MKLQHLCGKHCELVQRDPEQAVLLWHGAFNHGVGAFKSRQWHKACRFLGTAWEISLLRFAQDMSSGEFSIGPKEFGAVARYYTSVSCRLEYFETSESCLRRAHDGLLHWSQEIKVPYMERLAAYEQLDEFRQRLTALLNLTGRQTYAKCWDLMALQLSRQASHSLLH